jgi:hypothetical protein
MRARCDSPPRQRRRAILRAIARIDMNSASRKTRSWHEHEKPKETKEPANQANQSGSSLCGGEAMGLVYLPIMRPLDSYSSVPWLWRCAL